MEDKKEAAFPPEVIQELQYYVYRLIDPRNGETFYVGKGKGNRVFNHMKCNRDEESLDDVDDKIETIREIHAAGLNVIHVIHRHGMDEPTAFEVEAALIDAYPGVTNSMGGAGSNDFGPMNSREIINKYAAEEAEFRHKLLIITINKTATERSIYDACRFAWRLKKQKAGDVEYVLAVIQGIIVGVFKPVRWMDATIDNFPEFRVDRPKRIGFIGEEAEETVKKLYIGKRIPVKYRKKGAVNPVRYTF